MHSDPHAKIIPIRPDVNPCPPQKHRGQVSIWVPKSEYTLFSKVLYVIATDNLRAGFIRYYVDYYARQVEQKTAALTKP
ncbi:hypothetical protein [Desulfobulbus sp.]|uniref:hypothetical protein n=1 Tax=Desulfobulbus sp. TaxID=895 RepID=UPI00286EEF3F|nr:hypothetical protein [Desulfobulbus sp.]